MKKKRNKATFGIPQPGRAEPVVDDGRNVEALARRRIELTNRAEERGLDWQSRVSSLDADDDGLMVAALATLLGVSVRHAFDLDLSIDELEKLALRSQADREAVYRLAFGLTPEEYKTLAPQDAAAEPPLSKGKRGE